MSTPDQVLHIQDPQNFIAAYGTDAPVVVGKGLLMTLGQALEAERLLCPADTVARQDPARRLSYLAGILAAAGTLRPEDTHILDRPE